ncbi:MAG TPA: polyhydroxyalkanoate synthesis regulator DNA-binding domain-containing protein [Vicinamibacteria bacterium]
MAARLSTPRQITRYDNRKLYDATTRAYVTLDQLRARVVAGEDLEVVDQKTGEDLTTLTLAQVLLEGLRGSTARVPRQVLAHLIRLAFGPALGWGEGKGPSEAAARARQEAERIAGGLLAKGRLSLDDATAFRHELGQSVQHIVTDAQAGIEDRLRALLTPDPHGAHAALQGLEERLDHLTRRVKAKAPRKVSPPRRRPTARPPEPARK